MFLCDTHTHTLISSDSRASLLSMVRAAMGAGFHHLTTFVRRQPVEHKI